MKKPLREILAPLSTKDKMKYIWDYYRYHFIIGIIVIAVLSYIIYDATSKKEDVLNIVITNELIFPDAVQQFEEKVNKALLSEDEQDDSRVFIQTLQSSGNDANMQVGIDLQKLTAQMAAGMIDFYIIDEEVFQQMNEEKQVHSFLEMSGLKELTFTDEEVIYSKHDTNDVVGIKVSAINLFDEILPESDKILCIPITTKNEEYISRFIELINSNN